MASSGTINNTFRTGYAIRITWTVTSQDISTNASTVTATVQLVSLGSSYTINSSATKSGSLTVNGTRYDFTFSAALSGNQAKTIFTKTGIVVPHNSDGTKTCAFSCTAGIAVTLSGTYYGSVSASGSDVFNTIARASTISSVTASVDVNGVNACTVNISRKASTFTHTVVWRIGNYSYTANSVGTSTSYAIPMTWLNAIPNATTGTATVTVTTYSGSTQIGSAVSSAFKITAPASVVPSVSNLALSEAVSGLSGQFKGYVQNKSKIAVSVSASGVYSSTIKSYRTVIQGIAYTGASFTSGILTASGTVAVTTTVTDSRGRTASLTKNITVIAYAPPTISTFTVFRANGLGTADYEGTMVNARITFAVSPVNNLNTKSYKVEYKIKSSTTWQVAGSGSVYSYDNTMLLNVNLSADYTYDIRLTLTDYFESVMATGTIPTAYTLLDFNSSGKGVAFGKVSEQPNAMEINMDIFDKHGTQFRNGLAYYLSGGAIDADTTTEELVLTSTNVPISGTFFFVRTMFYSAKTATANRTQMAYPYNKVLSTYYRYYINGDGWSAWVEQPVVTSSGTLGIWNYVNYSDGRSECTATIAIGGVGIELALGGWFRSYPLYEANYYEYPLRYIEAPTVEMMYQTTDNNGAMLWCFSASAENAKLYLPQCYLIRPTALTATNGKINVSVKGRYK